MATAVIHAEAKLGELLKAIPRQGNNLSSLGGTKPTLPSGVSKRTSHQAQTIADRVRQGCKMAQKKGTRCRMPSNDFKRLRVTGVARSCHPLPIIPATCACWVRWGCAGVRLSSSSMSVALSVGIQV